MYIGMTEADVSISAYSAFRSQSQHFSPKAIWIFIEVISQFHRGFIFSPKEKRFIVLVRRRNRKVSMRIQGLLKIFQMTMLLNFSTGI